MTTAHPDVRENDAQQRFELWLGDERIGLAAYQGQGEVLRFVHTEIDDRYEGRGFGSQLVRGALDAVRDRGSQVLPYCPFVKAFLLKHPDYADLVPADQRSAFDLPA